MRWGKISRAFARLTLLVLCLPVAACGVSTPGAEPSAITAAADDGGPAWTPIALTPVSLSSVRATEMPIADAGIEHAVNLYRMQHGEALTPFARAGADLNGDGTAEVVAYLSAPDCAATGCPMLVFALAGGSYQVMSRTDHVLPPIAVAASSHNHWRDLTVRNMARKTVQIGYSGNGYVADADERPETVDGLETLIASAESRLPAAAAMPVTWPATKTASPLWGAASKGGDAEEAAGGQ